MKQITIELTDLEYQGLVDLAMHDLRSPEDQAAFILMRKLVEMLRVDDLENYKIRMGKKSE